MPRDARLSEGNNFVGWTSKYDYIKEDIMEKVNHAEIIARAKTFFREEIVASHLKGLAKASTLKAYKFNPFLVRYLANFLKGDDSPRSIAEVLVYPRVLGTSVATIFGNGAQKMISQIFEGMGSTTSGMDIEFVDALDGRKKYCQVKAGPLTPNHDDVATILGHFKKAKNLARQNHLDIRLDDLVVGVLYGEGFELGPSYKLLKKEHPVFVGKEFWHRLTGKEGFYFDLINAFGEVAREVDGRGELEEVIAKLAVEIEQKFNF
ncbi:MAG: PmeII family type II restriction endonuclease [Saprospiraceae bacterium]